MDAGKTRNVVIQKEVVATESNIELSTFGTITLHLHYYACVFTSKILVTWL